MKYVSERDGDMKRICSIYVNTLSDVCSASAQADAKLKEEEKRALRYLETRRECNSVEAVSIYCK